MKKLKFLNVMKKVFFGFLFAILFVISSCSNEDEGYSLGDIWIGLGIVDSTQSLRITMDDGTVLVPVAYYNAYEQPEPAGNQKKIEAGDRVYVNFTVLDDERNSAGEIVTFYVRINSMTEILMKGILDITPAIEDSIGNDPIIVQKQWVSNNLLNFELKYWGRNKVHYINLVKKPGTLTASGQPFELELRHNANDDEEAIPFVALVSIELDRLKVAGLDSVKFKVKSMDYDAKTNEFTGVYKYGSK